MNGRFAVNLVVRKVTCETCPSEFWSQFHLSWKPPCKLPSFLFLWRVSVDARFLKNYQATMETMIYKLVRTLSVCQPISPSWINTQGSTKVVSDSPGLVDFPVGQAEFSGHLPDGQAWLDVFMACYRCSLNSGLVQNSYRQVRLKYRLPKGQARISIFAKPWTPTPHQKLSKLSEFIIHQIFLLARNW